MGGGVAIAPVDAVSRSRHSARGGAQVKLDVVIQADMENVTGLTLPATARWYFVVEMEVSAGGGEGGG